MKSKLIAIVAAIAALSFAGCSSTATGKPAAKLVVQYAVLKVVANNQEKAARVVEIAKEVQAVAGNDGFNTVSLLMTVVRTKIDYSKLDAADTLLANLLIETVEAELSERVGAGVIPEGSVFKVKEVASWVIDGAALAGK